MIPRDDPVEMESLLKQIRNCRLCAGSLPRGPRPVIQADPRARLLIIGQAPGTKVHETGIPWNDSSGARLREWMAIDRDTFYDPAKIAIMPMGMCYPGRLSGGGDAPPRRECAPAWHEQVLTLLANVRLTLLIGGYAHRRYTAGDAGRSVWTAVAQWRSFLPDRIVLPHPSWRNNHRLSRPEAAWFDTELLPDLRAAVRRTLDHP